MSYLGCCDVVDTERHLDAIISACSIARDYYWPTSRFYEKFVDGDRVYKYKTRDLAAELYVVDGLNEIRVLARGKVVGLIPRENFAEVKDWIAKGATAKLRVTGGPFVDVVEKQGRQLDEAPNNNDFSLQLLFYSRQEAVVARRVSDKNYTVALLRE